MKRKTGQYITISNVGEKCRAFVPAPLPPKPELAIDGNLRELLDQTLLALGPPQPHSSSTQNRNPEDYCLVLIELPVSSQLVLFEQCSFNNCVWG